MYSISLNGKTAVVTGAARGIGRCIAVKLAQAGAKGVTVIDVQESALAQTGAELEALGAETIICIGDVARDGTLRGAIAKTVERWGSLDILVNNAGIARATDFFSSTGELWDRTLEVNLRSVYLGMKYGAEAMKDRGGAIVNIASLAGITGGNTGPEYAAAKAGVIGLTKYGAKTLGRYGIRVNALAPGSIDTDMIKNTYGDMEQEDYYRKRLPAIPMGRIGDPEEVAKAALFLASGLSGYVSGDIILVTGARES